MKKTITILCGLLMALQPVMVLAADTAATSGVEGGTAVKGTANNQPSVKNGADQSSSGNGMAQALNYVVGGAEVVMGGYMIKTGIAQNSSSVCGCAGIPNIAMGTMMVAMGLQNIAQGNEHGSSAGQANITGFQTDGFGTLSNPDTSTTNPYTTAAQNDPNYKAVGSTLKKLEAAGVYNPKLGTFKVGDKTYKQSDFASKEAMAAAGMPPGMIDGAMSANAEAEKKALAKLDKVKPGAATAENGYADGGGGGAGGWSSGAGDDGSSSSGYAGAGGKGGLGKSGLERDPSSLAGMSKNYNGEPIGVAADSIFLMMSRRYKVKESQESFFSPADLALQNAIPQK